MIKSQTFGENIYPETPLYRLDIGTDYPARNIVVRIAVKMKSDRFYMPFYFDAVTHQLDAIPISTIDNQSITFVIRHSGSIFVSSIARTALKGKITSAFDVAHDAWNIPNVGTSAFPNGLASGLSLGALWYYCSKWITTGTSLGSAFQEPTYSNDTLWMAHPRSFRAVNAIESACAWTTTATNLIEHLTGGDNTLTRNELAYALLATHKPQALCLTNRLITARVPIVVTGLNENLATVYDPCYPGATDRSIDVSAKATQAYSTSYTVSNLIQSDEHEFPFISYIGGYAILDYATIAAGYSASVTGVPQDLFSGVRADHGVIRTGDTLQCIDPAIRLDFSGRTKTSISIYLNGAFRSYSTGDVIPIKRGENVVGIYMDSASPYVNKRTWVGWQWLHASFEPLLITMKPTNPVSHTREYFGIVSPLYQQSGVTFEWNFGDGTTEQRAYPNDTISHVYDHEGSYPLTIHIRPSAGTVPQDSFSQTIIVSAPAVAIIPLDSTLPFVGTPQAFVVQVSPKPEQRFRIRWTVVGVGANQVLADTAWWVHTFASAGMYTLRADLLDSKDIVFASTTRTIQISPALSPPTIAELQSKRNLLVRFTGDIQFDGTVQWYTTFVYGTGSSRDSAANRLQWDQPGTTCSLKWSTSWSSHVVTDSIFNFYHDESDSRSLSISIHFATDYSTVSNFACASSHAWSEYSNSAMTENYNTNSDENALEGNSISYHGRNNDTIVYRRSGPMVEQLLSKIEYKASLYYKHGASGHADYVKTNWSNSAKPPIVDILFY
ncbi:MAG: PKD domain-containing protein [Bacteroidetes bacterium]|nr:PKD domain-containing protein [Bacteroidota bacterium]